MYENKKLEDLNLSDSFLFAFAMSDKGICKEFLEKLLMIDIEELEIVKSEWTQDVGYAAKSVRFDIYARARDGQIYEIEMQNANKGNIPKRSRYYSSIIDTKELSKGSDYNKLPQSYVIFICTFDPFGDGRHIYTFENICVENHEIRLQDGSKKVTLNTRGTMDDVSDEIKDFLKYVEKSTAETAELSSGSLTRHMHGIVTKIKDERQVDYMTFLELIKDEKDESFKEGVEQEKLKNAKAMKDAGIKQSVISNITGLSAEEIMAL